MKKFEKEIIIEEIGVNKIVDFIGELIDVGIGGDWSDHYVEGDIIKYDVKIDEYYIEDLKEDNLDINEIKEFIGKGICLVDELLSKYWNKEICYNIEFIDNEIVIIYEYLDLE
jgi:hypothetical protein